MRSSLSSWQKTTKVIFCPQYDPMRWQIRSQIESETGYFNSWQAESNEFLYEHLAKFKLQRVLEVGSNSGNRLFQIAQRNPSISFVGIDLNKEAIALGQSKVREFGLNNLEFRLYDIRNVNFLSFLKEQSFDTLISWATLIYLHPIYVKRFFQAIDSSTIERVLLVEQDSCAKSRLLFRGTLVGGGPNWARNYQVCFERFCSKPKFEFRKVPVPRDIWSPGGGNAKLIFAERSKSVL